MKTYIDTSSKDLLRDNRKKEKKVEAGIFDRIHILKGVRPSE